MWASLNKQFWAAIENTAERVHNKVYDLVRADLEQSYNSVLDAVHVDWIQFSLDNMVVDTKTNTWSNFGEVVSYFFDCSFGKAFNGTLNVPKQLQLSSAKPDKQELIEILDKVIEDSSLLDDMVDCSLSEFNQLGSKY